MQLCPAPERAARMPRVNHDSAVGQQLFPTQAKVMPKLCPFLIPLPDYYRP